MRQLIGFLIASLGVVLLGSLLVASDNEGVGAPIRALGWLFTLFAIALIAIDLMRSDKDG